MLLCQLQLTAVNSTSKTNFCTRAVDGILLENVETVIFRGRQHRKYERLELPATPLFTALQTMTGALDIKAEHTDNHGVTKGRGAAVPQRKGAQDTLAKIFNQ